MERIKINHCFGQQFVIEKWGKKKNSCRVAEHGEQDSGSERILTCKIGDNCNWLVIF